MRPVALPALKALGSVVTRAITIVVDHVEDVALRPLLRHRVFIMRTVDIQVVIYAHVDVVVPTMKPGWKHKTRHAESFSFIYLNLKITCRNAAISIDQCVNK